MTGDTTDRPPFLSPNVHAVTCHLCGDLIEDMSRVDGIDVSEPDAYYPDMKPVCQRHDTGGTDE
jgi:hypothetical protein